MASFVDILSSIAIVIFVVSALPQIWKLARSRTARDISLWMSVLIAVGDLLMLIRSVRINDGFFIWNYVIQSALWVVIIVLILKYRNR